VALKLIIFDMDGTLVEKFTLNLLPGVRPFFDLLLRDGCEALPRIAVATNQGGVGLRYWLQQRGERFSQYPTEEEVERRLHELAQRLGAGLHLLTYAAYRYQTKEGFWVPAPPGAGDLPRWQADWRKPGPGMLLQAMQDAGAGRHETLFVGDSTEDQLAAQAAGCAFVWAANFFSQRWTCASLQALPAGLQTGEPG